MRVVYVSSLAKGGPVAHLRTLTPAVARAGADVHVVCGDEEVAESFERAGISASVAALRHKADLAGARRVRRLLAGADVVHTHDRRAGLLARPAARLGGAHAVHTYHGLPEEIAARVGRDAAIPPMPPGTSRARVAWLLHGYLRLEGVLARFGTIVVPSDAMARFLTKHGIPRARIRVVPHGIDSVARVDRPAASGSNPVVVGVAAANLEYHKGVDVLIEACAIVNGAVRLTVFGDGSWRERLERLAVERGVDADFVGHVAEARDRFHELDVLAVPSRAENFPIVVLEAMAAALPVVATRVGGIPELVADGETGLIVEPENPEALAAALDSLVASPHHRRSLGAAGARRVADEFTADQMATRMLAVYGAP